MKDNTLRLSKQPRYTGVNWVKPEGQNIVFRIIYKKILRHEKVTEFEVPLSKNDTLMLCAYK